MAVSAAPLTCGHVRLADAERHHFARPFPQYDAEASECYERWAARAGGAHRRCRALRPTRSGSRRPLMPQPPSSLRARACPLATRHPPALARRARYARRRHPAWQAAAPEVGGRAHSAVTRPTSLQATPVQPWQWPPAVVQPSRPRPRKLSRFSKPWRRASKARAARPRAVLVRCALANNAPVEAPSSIRPPYWAQRPRTPVHHAM